MDGKFSFSWPLLIACWSVVGLLNAQESAYRVDVGKMMFDESYQEIREKLVDKIGPYDNYIVIAILTGKRDGLYTFLGIREVLSDTDPFSSEIPVIKAYESVLIDASGIVKTITINKDAVAKTHAAFEIVTRNPIPGFRLRFGEIMSKKYRPDVVLHAICRRQVARTMDNSLYGGLVVDPEKRTNCERLLELIKLEVDRVSNNE